MDKKWPKKQRSQPIEVQRLLLKLLVCSGVTLGLALRLDHSIDSGNRLNSVECLQRAVQLIFPAPEVSFTVIYNGKLGISVK